MRSADLLLTATMLMRGASSFTLAGARALRPMQTTSGKMSRGIVGSGGGDLRSFTALAATLASAPAVSAATAQPLVVPDLSVPPAEHPGFTVLRDEMVDEYGVRATMYKHDKSGAEVLSVIAPDENKVFGVNFRTPPKDSTGVPHILEHSVLCGSRKYTSKEPFVELLKGSLQTFLNAFTYPDRTCYPVASCNLKDFYNLANVYLDAVFHPRAIKDEMVLRQEGWHYEIENPDEPLTFKGVVYNEMKGVYSSPDSLMARATQQALFPSNTYGVDSGGDPLRIPDLTFDGFKAFHGEFYHPSNSRVFFYGDDPVPERLSLLDSYLSEFDAIEPDSAIAIQPLEDFTSKARLVEKFPASEKNEEASHMIAVNWVLHDEPLNPEEQLVLAVVDHLLMGTNSAHLRKALTDSGFGNEVIGGGLSDELSQATFSVGLKGVKPQDVEAVEKLVHESLKQFATDGPDPSAVEASLNSIEFSLREFNTGSFPKGLSVMLSALNQWVYDRDALAGLRFDAPLKSLKAKLEKGEPVFASLVQKMLLDNKHRISVEMVPDTELEARQTQEESDVLAAVKSQLTPEDIQRIIDETTALKKAQAQHDSPEQLATIPSLELKDLNPNQLELPIDVTEVNGVKVLTHDVPSNGILYADVGFDLTVLDAEDLPLVGLFARCLTQTGTATMDEVALSRRIGARTGGLSASTFSAVIQSPDGTVSSGDELEHRLFLRGKAVASAAPELFNLAQEVLFTAKLDNQKRIVEMLKESKSGLEASLVSSGHAYASTRLSADHSLAGALGEATGGVSMLESVKANLAMAENDFPKLQARLEAMRSRLLSKTGALINLSADANTLTSTQPAVEAFVNALPEAPANEESVACQLEGWKAALLEKEDASNDSEGFVVPTQVNYVGKGGRLYQPGDAISGSASVVARALRTGYLWDTVRVMGGAYGGFCRFVPTTGTFSYLSYRDPNLVDTLDNYDGTAPFLAKTELTDEALSQAIIGAVGDLDGPLSPDAKGWEAMRRYLSKETPEMRAQWRKEILATTKEDFAAFGARLEEVHNKKEGGMRNVVFGSKQALEDANKALEEQGKPAFKLLELL